MTTTEQTAADSAQPDDDFEYAVVEIFGHRRHAGRTREEERFGAKMLRVDVPIVERCAPEADDGKPALRIIGWQTHYYGGAAIFSFSLTDANSVLLANRPRAEPSRLTYQPHDDDIVDEEF